MLSGRPTNYQLPIVKTGKNSRQRIDARDPRIHARETHMDAPNPRKTGHPLLRQKPAKGTYVPKTIYRNVGAYEEKPLRIRNAFHKVPPPHRQFYASKDEAHRHLLEMEQMERNRQRNNPKEQAEAFLHQQVMEQRAKHMRNLQNSYLTEREREERNAKHINAMSDQLQGHQHVLARADADARQMVQEDFDRPIESQIEEIQREHHERKSRTAKRKLGGAGAGGGEPSAGAGAGGEEIFMTPQRPSAGAGKAQGGGASSSPQSRTDLLLSQIRRGNIETLGKTPKKGGMDMRDIRLVADSLGIKGKEKEKLLKEIRASTRSPR